MEGQKGLVSKAREKRVRRPHVPVILAYILFIAGALWHLLGWFQSVMRVLAGAHLPAAQAVYSILVLAKGAKPL